MDGGYKLVDHTADVGLKAWGQDQKDLLEAAAAGMASQVCDPSEVQEQEVRTFVLEAETLEELLLQWLKEILYRMEHEGLVFRRFQIEKDNFSIKNDKTFRIEASAHGEARNPTRHSICKEIKAITRHGLYVKKNGPWWEANILFDV